jgi:hypothetical protein
MRHPDAGQSLSTRIVAVVAASILVTVFAAAPATGDPRLDDGSGGSAPPISGFGNVALNGTPQLATASIAPFLVIDDSGALGGWNVTLLAPTFRNGTGADCATGSTATIDATTLSMGAPVVRPADGLTSMLGVTSAGFTDFTTARKIVVADVGHGDGTYTVAPQILKLTVPASVYAENYCTEITVSITTGP